MKKPAPLPGKGVTIVDSATGLFARDFDAGTSVILLPGTGARELKGDFNALASVLWDGFFRTTLPRSLPHGMAREHLSTPDGRFAAEAARILADMELLREGGMEPELRIVPPGGYGMPPPGFFRPLRAGPHAALSNKNYPVRGNIHLLRGNTHLFHADGGDPRLGRALCCYNGAATEGLPPGAARPFSGSPGVRRRIELLADGDDFRAKKLEQEASSHFFPARGARPFAFRLGDLWRQATLNGPAGIPPFIHRASPAPGNAPRLMVVGNPMPFSKRQG